MSINMNMFIINIVIAQSYTYSMQFSTAGPLLTGNDPCMNSIWMHMWKSHSTANKVCLFHKQTCTNSHC